MIPTLRAGSTLDDCVRSLRRQTLREIEVLIVDNSGRGAVRGSEAARLADATIENAVNIGFGAAVNQGFRRGRAPYLATLNDDAVAESEWLEALVSAMESNDDVGLCASRVVLAGRERLDSAGMLICGDGTSKQRGQGRPPSEFPAREEVLFPSGSAALYRRRMIEEVGMFDEEFFLYCEDTDLGLRARWAGWRCLYEPGAVVQHHYSRSAGRASSLKAYYVERNRLFVIFKNFPLRMLVKVPAIAISRYFWHVAAIGSGSGAAAEYRRGGNNPAWLIWYVVRSHFALLAAWPRVWRQRRAIRRNARISAGEFRALLERYSIGPRQVASL